MGDKAKRSKCKGCGEEIIWLRYDGGKLAPVNPKSSVFVIESVRDGQAWGRVEIMGVVCHLTTCKNPTKGKT